MWNACTKNRNVKVSQETTLGSFPVGFELFKCNFLAADAKKIDPHYRHCPIGPPRAIFGGSKADLLSPNSKRNCNIKIGR